MEELRRKYAGRTAARVLKGLSDEELKELGLTRDQVEVESDEEIDVQLPKKSSMPKIALRYISLIFVLCVPAFVTQFVPLLVQEAPKEAKDSIGGR